MKILLPLSLLVLVLSLGLSFSPAHAATVGECQALIDDASDDLAVVEIGGNHPERTLAGLQSKLDGAATKLDEGNFQDAVDKLVDFRTEVEKLVGAARPKISQADAGLLIADANAAIACIEILQEG